MTLELPRVCFEASSTPNLAKSTFCCANIGSLGIRSKLSSARLPKATKRKILSIVSRSVTVLIKGLGVEERLLRQELFRFGRHREADSIVAKPENGLRLRVDDWSSGRWRSRFCFRWFHFRRLFHLR